ncbi:MAG: 3-dehydroquinate synthase [Balneolaceae bacterium]|nr:3-dehydroquinate synthase [Balneolaceae bacterium]
MSQIIKVSTSTQASYPIHVGQNLWDSFNDFCATRYSKEKLFVIVDEKVWKLHADIIEEGCNTFFNNVEFFDVPEGEKSKSFPEWNKLVDATLKSGIERKTPILAIGGGVTGDLAGFVAASVLRGVPLIHMPTSLLAMVDSSIGGKTGINHATGKNLIGAFYQPDAVFADINYLTTLERKEWINGLSEMLKYAAIEDESLFQRLEDEIKKELQPSPQWAELITDCARIKTKIVEKDTLESGVRAYLNFGHTFGHALEKYGGYGTVSHGEAVFLGMLAGTYASEIKGANIDNARFDPFLSLYDLTINTDEIEISQLVEIMSRDKKVKDGVIRLVLLSDWESPFLFSCEDKDLLFNAWEFAFKKLNTKK